MLPSPLQRTESESAVRGVQPFIQDEANPFQWLYKPRTVTGLALAVSLIVYYGFFAPDIRDSYALAARAVTAVVLCFLVYCSIQLRDSILMRPHPVVWRVVHGLGIVYLLFMVILLIFPTEQARQLLRVFDTSLGVRPAENDKLYATDCRIYTPGDANGPFARVKEVVWDPFVIAHSVGWWAKALLLRDWRLGWALSILWEVIEYSAQGILPNFKECHFDHWIIDVALCNAAGLFLGMWTVRWLELKAFDWTGREARSPTPAAPSAQLSKLVYQFRPQEFAHYEWRIFEKPKHLLAAVLLIVIMETIELNAFFLKYVLYLPPTSAYNVWRLVFWFAMSLPVTREYYAYAADDKTKRMGPNLWLAIACMVAEVLIIVKGCLVTDFPPGSHVPQVVLVCWAIAGAAFAAWTLVRFWAPCRPLRRPAVNNSLVAIAVAALAYLCYDQDVGWGQKVPVDSAMIAQRPSAGPFGS